MEAARIFIEVNWIVQEIQERLGGKLWNGEGKLSRVRMSILYYIGLMSHARFHNEPVSMGVLVCVCIC